MGNKQELRAAKKQAKRDAYLAKTAAKTVTTASVVTPPRETSVPPAKNGIPNPNIPKAAPPTPTVKPPIPPASTPTLKGSEFIGIVVARTFDREGINVLHGKIRVADGSMLTVHSKECTIPIEGTEVVFEKYEFETRNRGTGTGAKILYSTGNIDALIQKRMKELSELAVYKIVALQDYLAIPGSLDEKIDTSVVGTLPSGEVLYYIKDNRTT